MTLIQWLANGGAYAVLGLIWVGGGVAYANYASRLGRRYDAPNDGCLLGFACVVLTLMGGAGGLVALQRFFPWYILGSAAGAIALPAVACLVFARRMRAWSPKSGPGFPPGEFNGDVSGDSPIE